MNLSRDVILNVLEELPYKDVYKFPLVNREYYQLRNDVRYTNILKKKERQYARQILLDKLLETIKMPNMVISYNFSGSPAKYLSRGNFLSIGNDLFYVNSYNDMDRITFDELQMILNKFIDQNIELSINSHEIEILNNSIIIKTYRKYVTDYMIGELDFWRNINPEFIREDIIGRDINQEYIITNYIRFRTWRAITYIQKTILAN